MGIRHYEPRRARNAWHRYAEPRRVHGRHRAAARKSTTRPSRSRGLRCVSLYRWIFNAKGAVSLGPQPIAFEGAQVFVLPNPSGRDANFSYAEMLAAFRKLRRRLARSA